MVDADRARAASEWIGDGCGLRGGAPRGGALRATSGTIIAKLGVPSFIVTLGMSFVARGVALIISGGNVVSGLPAGVRNLGNEALFYVVPGEGGGITLLQKPDVAGDALRGMERVLQWPVVITGIVVLLAAFALARTQFGRHTYAIGGSRMASLRAGVPVDRMTILIFTLSAVTAGLAGCLYTARFAGGSAIAGEPLLLNSIAAVIIGGVSMFGGRGNVMGTVIGSLIIAILVTGLIMLGVDPFWQFIVIGIVVILAVLIDQARDLVAGARRRPDGRLGRTDGTHRCPVDARGHDLVKRFGGLTAVNGVSLEVAPARSWASSATTARASPRSSSASRASTRATRGRSCSTGEPVRFARPIDARRAGIETIYQDLALAGNLDVARQHLPGPRGRRSGSSRGSSHARREADARASRARSSSRWTSASRASAPRSRSCPAASDRRSPSPARSTGRRA